MTVAQEDALYDFLDSAITPFTVTDAVAFIKQSDSGSFRRLGEEVAAFIETRRLAFSLEGERWISRRGWFEGGRFILHPTRLEILNGIMIPGHRCIPFANPILLPHEYRFLWKGSELSFSTSEGPPEDFYPYYSLFGEEYAPQYIAKDNPENEAAYNADPYEDPPEVSIHTLDLRNVYRETAFIPGNSFVIRLLDWKGGVFELEDVIKDSVSSDALAQWQSAAEGGFKTCFGIIGPGTSMEEQIAFAYKYGGKRLLQTPAYALEEYIYEKTDTIDVVQYGMESRLWFAGKEIPDTGPWSEESGPPDKTDIEHILYSYGVPISEYVIQSYVRDALFRGDPDLKSILNRIVPESIAMANRDRVFLGHYILDILEEFQDSYNLFTDRDMGPLRRRTGELHNAVVDLTVRLISDETEPEWLPKHSFVILSQIQTHLAHLLEDLDMNEAPDPVELEAMDNSLDGMLETYEDVKNRIEEARDVYRRSRLSVVRSKENKETTHHNRTIQVALSGTEVWRRLVFPEDRSLSDLHQVIQCLFNWSGDRLHGFVIDGEVYGPGVENEDLAEEKTTIKDLVAADITEFTYDYDYGAEWELRLSILHPNDDGEHQKLCCLAGAGAAPPEQIGGALRFRRFISALQHGESPERTLALHELGSNFDPDAFDLDKCNQDLASLRF